VSTRAGWSEGLIKKIIKEREVEDYLLEKMVQEEDGIGN
jgi:hypothetical protein